MDYSKKPNKIPKQQEFINWLKSQKLNVQKLTIFNDGEKIHFTFESKDKPVYHTLPDHFIEECLEGVDGAIDELQWRIVMAWNF